MVDPDPIECRVGERRFFLRNIGASDAAAVLELFIRVFGSMPPVGWYEWKYGSEGLQGKTIGLWSDTGRLVAHYAGMPRRLLWHAVTVDTIQIGDVMVAPEARGLLTRRGPFYQVCSAFFRQWVGAEMPYAAAFGFPNERHIRLGKTLGLYRDLGTITGLTWPTSPKRLPFAWQFRELDADRPEFDAVIGHGWRLMVKNSQDIILGVRDAAYLRTRFVQRPAVSYRFLAVSRVGFRPAAVVVVLPTGEALRWLDFVGPRSLLPIAATAVRRYAAELGAALVETWASPAAARDLATTGAQAAGTTAHFALALASVCPDHSLANHGWWLAGDTDFL